MIRGLALLLMFSTLASCSLFEKREREHVMRLADLKPSTITETRYKTAEVKAIHPREVLKRYEALLEVADDPEIEVEAHYRIAGLKMLISEADQAEGVTDQDGELLRSYYTTAIDSFQRLLQQYPDKENNDQVLYQLAKAYELDGRRDDALRTLDQLVKQFPKSNHYAEAQFRRGELLFAQKDYRESAAAYRAVVDRGEKSGYYQNAVYMLGWTLFKRNQYELALERFVQVLDGAQASQGDLSSVTGSGASLVNDSLRIMSMIFSYLDSGDTVAQLFKKVGQRPYEYLIYKQLSELLISQERFGDAANTYKRFIDQYPTDPWAPRFHVAMIEAYKNGRFPSEIFPAKEHFVSAYGINSAFWKTSTDETKTFLRPHLHEYLLLITKYYHAEAQTKNKRLAKIKQPTKSQQLEVEVAYATAADWYGEFIKTFPKDPEVSRMMFLMAETLFEAKRFVEAIKAYETVAYTQTNTTPEQQKNAVTAGYMAIFAFQNHYATMPSETEEQKMARIKWRREKIGSQLRFAEKFSTDKRAVDVQTNAAADLFDLKDYPAAIAAADKIVKWQPNPTVERRLTAWLVIGHSQFELQQYAAAESAYQQTLLLMDKKHKERPAVIERLAASVYKQAEALAAAKEYGKAVEQFMRVGKIAPSSPIRVSADYDAAAHLLIMKDWPRAIVVLNDFRARYPKHKFTQDIPAKLALAYQETKQWDKAAAELRWIFENDKSPEAQRQALYLSAELYEKSGNTVKAIATYREYAHKYPDPFDDAMEVRYKLSEFYREQKDYAKRRYWLKQIMDADTSAGKKRTERSRYLAALASSVFADDARFAFNKIRLSLPLKASLNKKKTALKNALDAYQKTVDYGVAEFTTKSTYYIGVIYAQLSKDLMDSDRPKGLDELALEQYEILLEEQAFPFEEQAIEILSANTERSWQGVYDQWVKKSFASLVKLLPTRFDKPEQKEALSEYIF